MRAAPRRTGLKATARHNNNAGLRPSKFGPIVMEPSVDGAVIRPTPDEYEDGEEAV